MYLEAELTMYAQLFMFTLDPGTRSTADKMADEFAPSFKGLKGFKGVTFMGDDVSGEYEALSLWETKEDTEAAAAVLRPKSEQSLSGIAKGPPTRKYFEVYEPKG